MLTSLLVTPFWMPGMLLYSIVSAGLEGAARRARTGELQPARRQAAPAAVLLATAAAPSCLGISVHAVMHAVREDDICGQFSFTAVCLSASALSSVASILRSSTHCSPCPGARLRTFPQRAAPPGLPADITNHWLPMWLAPNLIRCWACRRCCCRMPWRRRTSPTSRALPRSGCTRPGAAAASQKESPRPEQGFHAVSGICNEARRGRC